MAEKAKLEDQICELEDNVARIQGQGKREKRSDSWRPWAGENILVLEVENALKHSKAYTRKARLEKQKEEMVKRLWLLGSEEEVKSVFQELDGLAQESLPLVSYLEALPKAS